MWRYCYVCGHSKQDDPDPNFSLYSVPKDEIERQRWISSIEYYLPPKGFVCSKHFPTGSVCNGKKRKGAVPVKNLVPKTPARSDDFEVTEPIEGKATATKGRYRYEMVKKSANNIITWVCAKSESEQCKGRLTSKFGIVLKQFGHSCKRETDQKARYDKAEEAVDKGVADISVEEISECGKRTQHKDSSTPADLGQQNVCVTISDDLHKDSPECDRGSESSKSNQVESDINNIEIDLEQHDDYESASRLGDSSENNESSESKKVICRLCLEPSASSGVTYLTSSENSLHGEEDSSQRIKALEILMYTNMIQTIMPNVDLGMACNPVMCAQCKASLIAAYNFVEKCTNNDNIIYLYKSKFDPDKIFCEDVVENMPLLISEGPLKKRLRLEPIENYENVTQISSQSNTRDNTLTEASPEELDAVIQGTVADSDINMHSKACLKPQTVVEEYIIMEDIICDIPCSTGENTSQFSERKTTSKNKHLSPIDCNKPEISNKDSIETCIVNKSFQVTTFPKCPNIFVLPKERRYSDVGPT